jgi:hypothetical protein
MYNYTNPIMQQVSKLCEDGHWPICKNEDGQFAVFSPILNQTEWWRRGFWKDTEEQAKYRISETYHVNDDTQPTEIIGFYHPPTPKFKVGDKVRFIGGNKIATIGREFGFEYEIEDKNGETETFSCWLLEPALETEPVIVEMTVAEIEEKLGVKNLKIVK